MLFVLFGTMGDMGYESRAYLESQGFEQVTKLQYAPADTAMVTRHGKRTYAPLEEVLRCDFVYHHNDFTVGFNKEQIIDAVTGRKDCLLSLSANSIDFIEQLKLAYGEYVTVIFVYTNKELLEKIVSEFDDITPEEQELRLSTGKRIRELFLEKRKVFDEVVLYGGEESIYDIASLKIQYDYIIQKMRRKQQILNNRNYVEMPYSGPDEYLFVSYSHEDKNTVYPILSMLQRNHCRIWYDEGIKGGENWHKLLGDKIEKCSQFLLFSSANSTRSAEVMKEIKMARLSGRPIVLVRLDEARFDLYHEAEFMDMHNLYQDTDRFEEKLVQSILPNIHADA